MKIDRISHRVSLFLSLFGLGILTLDFGFQHTKSSSTIYNSLYLFIIAFGVLSTVLRYLKNKKQYKRKVAIFDFCSTLFSIIVLIRHFIYPSLSIIPSFTFDDNWLRFAVFLTFIREFLDIEFSFIKTFLKPAQLFITSFLIIIFIGSLLLMLPNATHAEISFIDALFTSTSAVCVTGLIVVDTGSHFTLLGQSIILVLIQIGGLGILTFTSFFSYFFKGESSYENQLTLNNITNAKSINTVFKTLKYIILITLSIEVFSALLIYISLDDSSYNSVADKIFFSFFHAISAFCNAGFSTLPNSLYEVGFRFNYFLQIIVIITFVLGGLGFSIVENLINYIKYKARRVLTKTTNFKPWVLNINSRITLITTFIITIVAVISVYLLEYNNTLAEHNGFGKIITAIFTAATPRTAGFNTVDTSMLSIPTLLIVFLLMWIGASPASTGGGIKTSTFAVATINILSLAKGKSRVELFRREISNITIRRSYAVISLSLIVIGFSIFLLSITEKELDLFDIAFETFSAYSTVGLSLGITSQLSTLGKLIIIFTMFVGRVSMLTIIIAIFKKIKQKTYNYPTEEITIN